ncbi:MAG: Gfo/Idh/MocA family oxidoreductase [Rhodospirillaceae bacterium]|nr:Gfo/Idh/MocA family oxidoreductase [Rhodospirillaceae bacterium]
MNAPHLPLRLGVVGLGPMGMHHVRAVADLAMAKLTAVADVRHIHAEEIGKQFGCPGFANAESLLGAVDAAIIATPPDVHAVTAIPLLNVGIPCLIEKPLALNEADAQAIMAAAAKTNAVVAVGHVERFNPAAEALLADGIQSADVTSIDVRRFSPASGRQVPVDVVSDMMIHDLDVMLALKTDEVVAVDAAGAPDDYVNATLRFTDGTVARVAANRKADNRVRELKLTTKAHTYVLDFMNRTVMKTHGNATQTLAVTPHDALRAEIADFLSAVTTKQPPRVTAAHALKSMRVAWRILDAVAKTAKAKRA